MIIDNIMMNNMLRMPKGTAVDIYCPQCGCQLVVRQGRTKFIGCTGFPHCGFTINMPMTMVDSYIEIGEEFVPC